MAWEATICSVITPFHARLMGINYHLINRLNPAQKVQWRIAYNKEVVPSGSIREISSNIRKKVKDDFLASLLKYIHAQDRGDTDQSAKLRKLFPENAIVDGLSLREVLVRAVSTASKYSISVNLTPALELKAAKSLASYHHAFALD